MKATARHFNDRHRHEVEIGGFRFSAGAPENDGRAEGTPTPQALLAASLAACSTLTMEAYAKRKGWDIGDVAVEVDYEIAKRGTPARCAMIIRLPEHVSEEQRRSLMSVAAKSPVHRTLEGETMFDERLELTMPDAVPANGHRARPLSDNNALLRRFLRPYRRARQAQQEGARRGRKNPHSGLPTKRP